MFELVVLGFENGDLGGEMVVLLVDAVEFEVE